jgi:hypothetical protein
MWKLGLWPRNSFSVNISFEFEFRYGFLAPLCMEMDNRPLIVQQVYRLLMELSFKEPLCMEMDNRPLIVKQVQATHGIKLQQQTAHSQECIEY